MTANLLAVFIRVKVILLNHWRVGAKPDLFADLLRFDFFTDKFKNCFKFFQDHITLKKENLALALSFESINSLCLGGNWMGNFAIA